MTTNPKHDNEDLTPRALTDLVPSGMCIAMVNTMVGRTHTSRPVTVANTQGQRLSFLVTRNADWVTSIADRAALVHVTVANDANSLYLSLNGTAIVVHDTEDAVLLWSKPAGIWFDGPDDPNLAVLHFDVTEGHYWDGPDGILGRAVALARAAITSNDEALGTDGPVAAG